jgi:hypothetical protein
MITQTEVFTSLFYLITLYPILLFAFRDDSVANKRKGLWVALTCIAAGLAIKVGYEIQGSERNYYSILEVSRQSSTQEIRQAYKKVSRKYHPDKNTSPDAEEMFQNVKTAYDVLMDDSQRDIYNRFGKDSLAFDPRLDELKLISSLGSVYLFWIVSSSIFTFPIAARGARSWILIFGIIALVLELSLCLTQLSMPSWMPLSLTEQELMKIVHSAFPALIAALAAVSILVYIDIDKISIEVMQELTQHQKDINGVLQQLQVVVSTTDNSAIPYESMTKKLNELKGILDHSSESTIDIVDTLKHSESNGSNYCWLIFLFMFGIVYCFSRDESAVSN